MIFRYARLCVLFFITLSLTHCTCVDEDDSMWTFFEPWDEADVLEGDDAGPGPVLDPDVVVPPIDDDIYTLPDIVEEVIEEEIVDPREWEEGEWTTETVASDFPFSQVLNERTSLVVDPQGTMWLGYHACNDRSCSNPRLVIARKAIDGAWTHESVQNHRGLFALTVIRSEEPIVAYVDDQDQSFKVAMRRGRNDWQIQRLDVERAGAFDGFDITRDRGRYYVSFASGESSSVDFFVYDVAASQPRWRRLPSLDEAYSAALERGLGAGNDFNLYLVHRQSRFGSYGVGRYSLGEQRWQGQTYFNHTDLVSSFVVRRNNDLCMSHTRTDRLVVSCGDMNNLSRETRVFAEPISGYSSLIEGRDGSLFVAFHGRDNTSMRVARRDARQQWEVETAFQGSSYGISTAINHHDQLAMSFYTCANSLCSLRVLQKTYD